MVQLVCHIPNSEAAGAVRMKLQMVLNLELVEHVQYTDKSVMKLPALQLESVVRTLVAGLTALRRRGYAHGDIKPGNVLLRANLQEVVYVDFAMAYPLPHTFAGRPYYGTVGFGSDDCVRMSEASNISDTCAVYTDYGELDKWAAGVTAICMVVGSDK